MSQRLVLLEQIEKLEKETGITMSVQDPEQYRKNNKQIEKLRKKLMKLSSFKR